MSHYQRLSGLAMAVTPSSFDEAFDREIAAHYERSRAEERAHARPISTLLPIGLPPISVQEIEALRDRVRSSQIMRDILDDCFEAFMVRDRATLRECLEHCCVGARIHRACWPLEIYRAMALFCWRLYRETPAT